jgi:glycosyltransferase involved in cell wall biosynthesis
MDIVDDSHSSIPLDTSDIRLALFTGNYNLIRDGVAITLNRLVEFLERHHIPVIVVGPECEEPAFRHVGDYIGVPSISVPGRPEYRFSTGLPQQSMQSIRKFSPTLVHVVTPDLLGVRALAFAQNHGITKVGSYHTHFTRYLKYFNLEWMEPLGWKYLAWFYLQCRHIYVPTASMAEELRSHGIDRGLRIWSRGVDTARFSPCYRSEHWRQRFGFQRDDPVVAFVSRLVWEKDLSTLVETVRRVSTVNSRVRFLIVGDGPARRDLQGRIPEAAFAGFLTGTELAVAYASSDVFLFPSETETFGNVTLEAMASGLPVVAARAPGSRSLVTHGLHGLLSPPRDVGSFAESVLKLASDAVLRRRMSFAARSEALRHPPDDVNQHLLRHYREALDSRSIRHTRKVA